MRCRCGHEFCYDCGGSDCPHGMCKNKDLRRPPAMAPMPPLFGGGIFGGGVPPAPLFPPVRVPPRPKTKRKKR